MNYPTQEYRVVRITNDVDAYGECEDDTKEFPHLVKHVPDEMEIFVVSGDKWWPADQFFYMVPICEFVGPIPLDKLES